MSEIIYHGTCDTTFAPRVEHVPAREIFPEYYRLWLNSEVLLTFTREQFRQLAATIQDALAPVESDESYAASEALQQYRAPVGVHPIFAPMLNALRGGAR